MKVKILFLYMNFIKKWNIMQVKAGGIRPIMTKEKGEGQPIRY